ERSGTIEDPDVVEPEEAPGEEVVAVGVLAVDPPGEVEQELLEDALEEEPIAPATRAGHLVHPPAGPGVHRRVHVPERELVRRQLAVGMHVPLAEQENELLL